MDCVNGAYREEVRWLQNSNASMSMAIHSSVKSPSLVHGLRRLWAAASPLRCSSRGHLAASRAQHHHALLHTRHILLQATKRAGRSWRVSWLPPTQTHAAHPCILHVSASPRRQHNPHRSPTTHQLVECKAQVALAHTHTALRIDRVQ